MLAFRFCEIFFFNIFRSIRTYIPLLFFQRVPLLSIMIADEVPDYGDADQYINDPAVEQFWAIKAYMQANVHMNLIMSVTPSGLRLNTRQDDIYASFRKHFPTLNVEKVTEVELKGDTKSVWRELCEEFKDLEDYNMGTLLRQDSTKCYSQDNTIIVPKMIYLAIEIARNIEGVNDRSKEAYTTDHKQEEAREAAAAAQ